MDKKDVVHIYLNTMEYYSAIKKNKTLAFSTTWMALEGLNWNKSEKDKYVESKKNKTNERKNKQKQTYTETGTKGRVPGTRGRRMGEKVKGKAVSNIVISLHVDGWWLEWVRWLHYNM